MSIDLYDIVSQEQNSHEKRNAMSEEDKIKLYLETEDINEKDNLLEVMSEESKMSLIEQIKSQAEKTAIIMTLNEEKRIELLSQDIIKLDMLKSKIIKSISYDKRKEMLVNAKIASKYQGEIIDSLYKECEGDISKKIDLLNISLILEKRQKTANILMGMNQKTLLENLDKIESKGVTFLRNNKVFTQEYVSGDIEYFMEHEGVSQEQIPEKKEILEKLHKRNDEVCYTINFDFLDNKIMNNLSEEQFEQIACYPETQNSFVEISKDGKKIEVFKACLDNFMDQNKGKSWNEFANKILYSLSHNYFDELIENIDIKDGIDLDKLSIVLAENNCFNIKTAEELKKYEEIKDSVCDSIINDKKIDLDKYPHIKNMSVLERKKFAILQKLYGQDLSSAKNIIEKYGEDIENITSLEENSIVCVEYVKSLQAIIDTDDEEILQQFYDIQIDSKEHIDPFVMEEELKSTYAREYRKGLFNINEAVKINDEKADELGIELYDAGTEFNMIVTSVAAFYGEAPENYEDNWNRNALASQGFCASYIRNDMLGTAPIKHLCYGFSDISDDSLMLSGPKDLYSDAKKLVATANRNEKYYTPNTQIDKTERYNEMVLKRMQEGERRQPDYIVVFKKDGKIFNLEEAKKAQENFGGKLPIVVIDSEKCIKSELEKMQGMIEEYEETSDKEILKNVLQKERNNRAGSGEYFEKLKGENAKVKSFFDKVKTNGQEDKDIQTDDKKILEDIKDEKKKEKISKEEYFQAYNKVGEQEKQASAKKIMEIARAIENIRKQEVTHDNGERSN